MNSSFKDHFSDQAGAYARHRPDYPASLFVFLAARCPAHRLAWDCATGNGQAALDLAGHFDRVVATDASAEQIARATPHPRVAYHVAPAEQAPLDDKSADLVTAAQALHWFDVDAFFAEARRVLRPDGLLAVWCYGTFRIAPAIDPVLDRYYREIIGPYWPPERRLVEEGYRTIALPFDEIETPALELEACWRLDDVLGYLGTWSSAQRFRQEEQRDPVTLIREELAAAWGDSDTKKTARWPLHVRLGRKTASGKQIVRAGRPGSR